MFCQGGEGGIILMPQGGGRGEPPSQLRPPPYFVEPDTYTYIYTYNCSVKNWFNGGRPNRNGPTPALWGLGGVGPPEPQWANAAAMGPWAD